MKGGTPVSEHKTPIRKKQPFFYHMLLVTLSLLLIYGGLLLWKTTVEDLVRWTPDYNMVDLPEFSSLSDLDESDRTLLFEQTGLSSLGLQRLEEAGRLDELTTFQRAYFLESVLVDGSEESLSDFSIPLEALPTYCEKNSPISWEEWMLDLDGSRGWYYPMVPLKEGDILLTPNSYSFGWRQGHSALVVDVEEGLTLESVVLGQNSTTQWVGKWQGFPAVIVLQHKEESLGAKAAQLAMEYLYDIPYTLTIGVLSNKYRTFDTIKSTNCSHLVWQVYQWLGTDIDGNGGVQAFPQDIGQSDQLEIVQIWGVNPDFMWAEKG